MSFMVKFRARFLPFNERFLANRRPLISELSKNNPLWVECQKAASSLMYNLLYLPYKLSYITHVLSAKDDHQETYEERTHIRGIWNIFLSLLLPLSIASNALFLIDKVLKSIQTQMEKCHISELYNIKGWFVWAHRLISCAAQIALYTTTFTIKTIADTLESCSRITFGIWQLLIAFPVLLSHTFRGNKKAESNKDHIDPLLKVYTEHKSVTEEVASHLIVDTCRLNAAHNGPKDVLKQFKEIQSNTRLEI